MNKKTKETIPLGEYLQKEHNMVLEGFQKAYDVIDAMAIAIKNHEKRIKELEEKAYRTR